MKFRGQVLIATTIAIVLNGFVPSIASKLVPDNQEVVIIVASALVILILSLIQLAMSQNVAIKELTTNPQYSSLLADSKTRSYAATSVVLNSDSNRFLLEYNSRQEKWLHPGSHVRGIERVHESAKASAHRETGYSVEFHPCHCESQYYDAHCQVVARPYLVQIEKQLANEGHVEHYDFVYILVADEAELLYSPGTHPTRWFSMDELKEMGRTDHTYPDVVNMAEVALKAVAAAPHSK